MLQHESPKNVALADATKATFLDICADKHDIMAEKPDAIAEEEATDR